MAVTATYSADLGRIRLAADTLGTATYAVFDRTTDGITWTTVRGGGHVTAVAGAAHVDDYEFPVNVAVTYRVRSFIDGGPNAHWWVSGPLNLPGWTAPDYTDIPTGSLTFGDRFVYPASHDKFTWNGSVWNYDGATGPDGTAGQVITNPAGATFTTVITQTLAKPWLKSTTRAFLNKEVDVSDAGDVTHLNRSQVFKIVARSNSVAVTDIGAGFQYDLTVATLTEGAAEELRYLATSGDIVFLHVPPGYPARGGYFTVGDVKETRQTLPWERRWFTLPLTSVAAPGPDVVPTTYTWGSALADYATWADLIAANTTWAALLERVGSPEDVIVP